MMTMITPQVIDANTITSVNTLTASNLFSYENGLGMSAENNSQDVSITFPTNTPITTLSLNNLTASSVSVSIQDVNSNTGYSATFDTQQSTATDYFNYFFGGTTYQKTLLINDLFLFSENTITIVFHGSNVSCGSAIVGKQQNLAVLEWDYTVALDDYSKIDFDPDFGNYNYIERNKAKKGDFRLQVKTVLVSLLQDMLADVLGKPTLFVGAEQQKETIVFGIASFSITVPGAVISNCKLSIKGLI